MTVPGQTGDQQEGKEVSRDSTFLDRATKIVGLLGAISALVGSLDLGSEVLSYVLIGVALVFVGSVVVRWIAGPVAGPGTKRPIVASKRVRRISGGAILVGLIVVAGFGGWTVSQRTAAPAILVELAGTVTVTDVMVAEAFERWLMTDVFTEYAIEQGAADFLEFERLVEMSAAAYQDQSHEKHIEVLEFVRSKCEEPTAVDCTPYRLSVPIVNASPQTATLTGARFVVERAGYLTACGDAAGAEMAFSEVTDFSVRLDPAPYVLPDTRRIKEEARRIEIGPEATRHITFFLRNDLRGAPAASLGLYDLEVALEFAVAPDVKTGRVLVAVPTLGGGLAGTGLDPEETNRERFPCFAANLCVANGFFAPGAGEIRSEEFGDLREALRRIGDERIGELCP